MMRWITGPPIRAGVRSKRDHAISHPFSELTRGVSSRRLKGDAEDGPPRSPPSGAIQPPSASEVPQAEHQQPAASGGGQAVGGAHPVPERKKITITQHRAFRSPAQAKKNTCS